MSHFVGTGPCTVPNYSHLRFRFFHEIKFVSLTFTVLGLLINSSAPHIFKKPSLVFELVRRDKFAQVGGVDSKLNITYN